MIGRERMVIKEWREENGEAFKSNKKKEEEFNISRFYEIFQTLNMKYTVLWVILFF